MSSWDYVSTGLKRFDNIDTDGYYISPAFLDKLTLHLAKNFMTLPKIKVPLILGIWGGKGQGKTFQCDLVYKKLGVSAIVMSAGELESGNAGEPAKLVRQRYREASDIVKKGKMASLFINDLVRNREDRLAVSGRPRAAESGSYPEFVTARHLTAMAQRAGQAPPRRVLMLGLAVSAPGLDSDRAVWTPLSPALGITPPPLTHRRMPARVAWAAPPSTPSTTRW